MALCLLALAFNFVPSSDILPNLIDPHSSAIAKTCSNMFFSDAKVDLAKVGDGPEAGSFPAASTLNGMSSRIRF